MARPLVTDRRRSALATVALHCATRTSTAAGGSAPSTPLTGLYCPGCGGLRAVNDLTDGHVGAALSSNILVDAADPGRASCCCRSGRSTWRGTTRHVPWSRLRPFVVALLTVMFLFAVVRNTPERGLAGA